MTHAFRSARTRAFTIIEMMVVVVILSILISLAVVGLFGARGSALQTKSLSNIRGIGQTLEMYVGMYRFYPFAPDGTPMYAMPPDEPNAQKIGFSPVWLLEGTWPMLMHAVSPWREHYPTWLSPSVNRPPGRPWVRDPSVIMDTGALPSYRYSNSFIARPSVWSTSAETQSSDVGPTSPADVATPSLKALMFDTDRAYLRGKEAAAPRPVLFADSSAAARRDSDATTPVQNRLHGNAPVRYHDTPNGVHGRDF